MTLNEFIAMTLPRWPMKRIEIEAAGSDVPNVITVRTQDCTAYFELDQPIDDGGQYVMTSRVDF